MLEAQSCHCGSKKKIQYCCGKYVARKELPATAEQLMKSRYTAFCQENIDYLIATLHPNKRQPTNREELAKTIKNTSWLGLTIINKSQRNKNDSLGFVEFVALFKINEPQQLHERSLFQKTDGQWFYVDGEILPDLIPKKNENCWCGSNKKYKKCHGESRE